MNASNLHTGGGVAVASSFLLTFKDYPDVASKYHVIVSSQIHSNLFSNNFPTKIFKSYLVHDSYPLNSLHTHSLISKYPVTTVFTVFGPVYFWFPTKSHIIGCADPYIPFFSSISNRLPFRAMVRRSLKRFIQSIILRLSSHIVVETQSFKESLVELNILPNNKVSVIPGAFHDVFLRPDRWLPIPNLNNHSDPHVLKIGLISNLNFHKNLSILPRVQQLLIEKYGIKSHLFLTLTDAELSQISSQLIYPFTNVGRLRLAQCPTFYSNLDAVIFPSLLESFSAVPIEALIMKKPLFASDRPFVSSVIESYCQYFDPDSPFDAANSIASYFSISQSQRIQLQDSAYNFIASSRFTSLHRFQSYCSLISRLS